MEKKRVVQLYGKIKEFQCLVNSVTELETAMTTTPAASRRRITNRRMFVIMLGRALARRRSRALAAIGSSAVGAATLFCLAAVCLAIPAQMNAQMRQFGANLILVPLQGSSEAATAGS